MCRAFSGMQCITIFSSDCVHTEGCTRLMRFDRLSAYSANYQQRINIFYVDPTVAFPYTISKSDLAALSSGSLASTSKRFEARANESFTSVTDSFTRSGNNLTVSVDFLYTGHKFRVSGGSLPTPLTAGTDYWMIYVIPLQYRLPIR